MEGNLLKEIITVSEIGANIARICRQDEHLLQLLTQEKSEGEKNHRFLTDFKTLADVLIQEVVKFHLSSRFAVLDGNIQGEESNTFTNTTGESITLNVSSDSNTTREALQVILNGNNEATERLLKAVYTEPTLPLTEAELEHLPCVDVTEEKYGVWIDPIDSTAEYINGNLSCALVLIGVYDKSTGDPVLGVINQPFHKKITASSGSRVTADIEELEAGCRGVTRGEGTSWQGKIYWGVSTGEAKHCELPEQKSRENPVIAISSSERQEVRDSLQSAGYELLPLPGAGYKLLSVLSAQCDLYLCSKPSTYVWDTLAPHAILKSLGGSVVQCHGASPVELKYNGERCNARGVLAYRSETDLTRVIEIIEKWTAR